MEDRLKQILEGTAKNITEAEWLAVQWTLRNSEMPNKEWQAQSRIHFKAFFLCEKLFALQRETNIDSTGEPVK